MAVKCKPGSRENIFGRALAKLQLGATEAEIKAYFESKGLKGRYWVNLETKLVVPMGTRGFTPWELLQKMLEDPRRRARLTEVIVTNHNRAVINAWEKAGLGEVVNQDGLRIFEKNPNFDQLNSSNWDYLGAHENTAAILAGEKGARAVLYVDRNTWKIKGLTAALHEAIEKAPPNMKELYASTARKTVEYLEDGRIEKRLLDPDAVTTPDWFKDNFLQDIPKKEKKTRNRKPSPDTEPPTFEEEVIRQFDEGTEPDYSTMPEPLPEESWADSNVEVVTETEAIPPLTPAEAIKRTKPEWETWTEEVTGAEAKIEITGEALPETHWETTGEPMNFEEVHNYLNNLSLELQRNPDLKHTLLKLRDLPPEVVLESVLGSQKLPTAEAKVLEGFINLWRNPELLTVTNINKVLKNLGDC